MLSVSIHLTKQGFFEFVYPVLSVEQVSSGLAIKPSSCMSAVVTILHWDGHIFKFIFFQNYLLNSDRNVICIKKQSKNWKLI